MDLSGPFSGELGNSRGANVCGDGAIPSIPDTKRNKLRRPSTQAREHSKADR